MLVPSKDVHEFKHREEAVMKQSIRWQRVKRNAAEAAALIQLDEGAILLLTARVEKAIQASIIERKKRQEFMKFSM